LPRFRPPSDPIATGPTYRGKSIFDWKVPSSGFEYGGPLEMYLCALAWGVRPKVWDQADPDEQALMIAVYRTRNQISAITDHYIVNRPKP
jgi:hypothetical protein